MKMIFVTPGEGMTIPNPFENMSLLAREGQFVPDDAFWRRRQAEGGVTISDGPPAAPVASSAAKASAAAMAAATSIPKK